MDKIRFNTIKISLLFFTLSIFSNQLVAQTTNGIFFQAVARDNFSNPAKDRQIYVESSIIQSTATGTKVLIELHKTTTDAMGVFNISLGNGTRTGGTASGLGNIDWSKGPFFLNLKIAITPFSASNNWDYTKELVDMGTTSFGTVPFALYSASSAKVNDKLDASDTTVMLKAYATNTAGTTYGPTISFTTPVAPIAINDIYGGGIVYYILKLGDNGYDANVQHGLIAQQQNEIDGLSSNPPYAGSTWNVIALNGNTITGAQNDGTLVGRANTAAIIANQGAGTYLFRYVSTLTINGYDDWYVPSIKEIKLFRDYVYNTTYCSNTSTTHYYWSSKANSSYKWTWGNYISSTQSGSSYYTNYLEGNSVGTRGYNQQQSGNNFVYLAIRSF